MKTMLLTIAIVNSIILLVIRLIENSVSFAFSE